MTIILIAGGVVLAAAAAAAVVHGERRIARVSRQRRAATAGSDGVVDPAATIDMITP